MVEDGCHAVSAVGGEQTGLEVSHLLGEICVVLWRLGGLDLLVEALCPLRLVGLLFLCSILPQLVSAFD